MPNSPERSTSTKAYKNSPGKHITSAFLPTRIHEEPASNSDDRNAPSRLAAALGINELRFANMQWGGGGAAAAVGNAAAAIAAYVADCVVVFRALAQG